MSQMALIRAGDSTNGIPATQDWFFAYNKSLTSRQGLALTASRASTGWYTNASGVLTQAAIDVPRFDHIYNSATGLWESRGLLIEEQRTNLTTYSSQFDNAAYTKNQGAVVADQIASPDGTANADKFTASAGIVNPYLINNVATASGSVYTFSIYVKKNTANYVQVVLNGVASGYANFDINSGVVGTVGAGGSATASIFNAGNGWFRCIVTYTTASVTGSGYINIINSLTDGRSATFTAAGTESIYIYGQQLELGSFATSLIPTTSASVTRSADICQLTGASFSGMWNATEGSFCVEGDIIGAGTTNGNYSMALQVDDGTLNNRIALTGYEVITSVRQTNYYIAVGGVQQALIYNTSDPGLNTICRRVATWKASNLAFSVNGSAALTQASGTIPTVSAMRVGSRVSDGFLNGHISRLRYFNKQLTVAQAEDLGKPELSKVLDYQFASSKSLTPLVGPTPSFSRASTGWYTNASGVLKRVPTNHITQSGFETGWSVNGATLTNSVAPAPFGASLASKLVPSSSGNWKSVYKAVGTATLISVYAKADGVRWLALMNRGATDYAAFFDLQNGTVGTVAATYTATIESVGNGWYRCSVYASTGAYSTFQANGTDADGSGYVTASGSNGILIWGAYGEVAPDATGIPGDFTETTTASNAGPRFDHAYNPSINAWECKGLLLEEQRTNLVLQSQDANNASWTKLDVTTSANNSAFVDGTVTAALMTATVLNTGRHMVYQTASAAAGLYTFSAYIKKTNNRYAAVGINDNNATSNRYGAVFDFDTGLVTTTLTSGSPTNTSNSVVNCGNGWYRVSVTMTNAGTSVTANVGLSNSATPASSFGMPSFLNVGTESVLLGGMQMELASAMSSLIPTTSGTVTRSADVCQLTGSNFSSIWNANEDTILCSFTRPMNIQGSGLVFPRTFMVGTGSSNFLNHYTNHGSPYNENFDMYSSAVAQLTLTAGPANLANVTTKYALGVRLNDSAVSVGGGAVQSDASCTIPAFATNLRLGALDTGANMMNGWLGSFTMYSIRLPNRLLIKKSS